MKKLSIAIAVLAAGVLAAGPVTHYTTTSAKNMVPTTIQTELPFPPCLPNCALPTPLQISN